MRSYEDARSAAVVSNFVGVGFGRTESIVAKIGLDGAMPPEMSIVPALKAASKDA